jgi:hypothetical protein
MPAPPKQRKMAIVGSRAVGEFALPIFTCKDRDSTADMERYRQVEYDGPIR